MVGWCWWSLPSSSTSRFVPPSAVQYPLRGLTIKINTTEAVFNPIQASFSPTSYELQTLHQFLQMSCNTWFCYQQWFPINQLATNGKSLSMLKLVLKPQDKFIKKTTYTIHVIINNIKSSMSTQKSPTVN